MDMRFFVLNVLLLVSIFANNAHSKNIYLKAELPIYKKYGGINKKDSKDHKISAISDSYGFGLGYNFSNYIETELIFNQMKYFIYSSSYNVGNVDYTHSHKINYKCELADKVIPYKTFCPCGIMTTTENSADESKIFTRGEFLKSKNKSEDVELKSSDIALKEVSSDIIKMKLQALVASVKLKVPNEGRVVPFLSLGAGVSRMKVNENKSELSKTGLTETPTLKNKTSFAYRVGVGTKIKVSSKVELELSARYFNYGKYKLSNDVSKKVTGHDLSAGIILAFN
ncbi:outer membrane beta-barrel protein [Candidatus Bandiella numerosa]|uniref:outer membrane protein n=1 Tax=Candidatus Bandiella numerosa TaxID=2570586 RepID=UPI00249DA82C|nr:outer membrane beta-barrel protein [Candidatus Bandiella numerosa]WHA05131.1 outer membrane beta-barrel protein [Candidatus Bandiella numerosa]